VEIADATERIDEIAGGQRTGQGVDREVASAEVLVESDRRVGDDLEVAMPRPDTSLRPRGRELDAGRGGRAQLAVPRVEANTHPLAVHLEILDSAVRLERSPQPGMVDAEDQEVLILV